MQDVFQNLEAEIPRKWHDRAILMVKHIIRAYILLIDRIKFSSPLPVPREILRNQQNILAH